MKTPLYALSAALLLLSASPFVQARAAQQGTAPPAPAAKPAKSAKPTSAPADRGERAFFANCVRCHQPPESLNPRITGTVVRHMRVRANLSAQDEQDILRFLTP